MVVDGNRRFVREAGVGRGFPLASRGCEAFQPHPRCRSSGAPVCAGKVVAARPQSDFGIRESDGENVVLYGTGVVP